MFDLEQSIVDWRKQMLAAGIKMPVPLEELEIHLREEIEQQMKSGTNPQQAFENSVQRIGHVDELKGEFKKLCGTQGLWFERWDLVGLWFERWDLVLTGVTGWVLTVVLSGALTPIWNWVISLVVPRNALDSLVHRPWAIWLPNYVTFTIFIISGLMIGFARWHTKWTLLWISSLGFAGTMIANSVCRFVFHGSDLISVFLRRADLPWWAFYANWMIFITMGLALGLSKWTLWLNKLTPKPKIARD